MRKYIILPLAAAALLIGCSPRSRLMPSMNNDVAITAAARSLSPWNDGSPDRSADGRTPAQDRSNRLLFVRWVLRYQQDTALHQHERNYKPMTVPWTIGQAIDEQRQYEQAEATVAPQAVAPIAPTGARISPQGQGKALPAPQVETLPATPGGLASHGYRSETSPSADQRQLDPDPTTLPQQDPNWQSPDQATTDVDFHCRINRQFAVAQAQEDEHNPDGAVARVIRQTPCPSDMRR